MAQINSDSASPTTALNHPSIEIIDSKELALRLRVPESWVRDRVRARSDDRLPYVKIGRYVRFEWGSQELVEWWRDIGFRNRERTVVGFKEDE